MGPGISGCEFQHVVGVNLEGFEGWDVEGLLLDEVVLDLTWFDGFEDGGKIGGAAAELGGFGMAGGCGCGGGFEVFDVQHGDAVWVLAQVGDWISAADGDPAAVHLEGDEGGIGEAEEVVVGDDFCLCGGRCGADGGELGDMVVVAEFEAGCFDLRAGLVELLGVPVPVVEGEGMGCGGAGGGRTLVAGRGADDVVGAEDFVEVDDGVEIALELVPRIVGADAAEAGGGHGLLDLGGGVDKEAGGFDLAVADGGDLAEGAVEVFGEQVANRVELQAEGQAERGGEQAAGVQEGGAVDGGGGCGFEEVSSCVP